MVHSLYIWVLINNSIMVKQFEMVLPAMGRGYHLVTRAIEKELKDLPERGICHIMIRHTSAGLTLNENADPTVRDDFASFFDRLIPDDPSQFTHVMEGADDMPAHLKSSLIGHSVTIPVVNGRLALGTWQGIYLCEFRDYAGARRLTITVVGE